MQDNKPKKQYASRKASQERFKVHRRVYALSLYDTKDADLITAIDAATASGETVNSFLKTALRFYLTNRPEIPEK